MLKILLFLLCVNGIAQNKNYDKWILMANEDPSLLPEYGNIEKTAEQKEVDQEFIDKLLAEYNGDKTAASGKMVDLGFTYLYDKGDLPTSMRRFNQAYLITPENPDIYYGYGTVYFNLGDFEKARDQYEKGLKIDPEHFEILTDYGTTYLGEYYQHLEANPVKADEKLDMALEKLLESYKVNPDYPSTTYKLSIIYLYKDDCRNSQKFLDLTNKLDKSIVSQEYLNDLNLRCRKQELDCSGLRSGTFRIDSPKSGVTTIYRTNEYQIEDNPDLNYKWKFSINWLDKCTYQLKPIEDLLNPENEDLPTIVVTCHITEVNPDNYVQVSTSDGNSLKLSSRVEILELN